MRLSNPILKAILKYRNHPKIIAIRNANINPDFYFNKITVEEFYKEIRKLSSRKSALSIDIPIRVFKENADIFADYTFGFTFTFSFLSIFESANITPVFKKGYRCSKENYHPVSILPVTSKFFEEITLQTNNNFHGSITVQIPMWVLVLNICALLMDLLKPFDCLPHELIIAKLNAYGFNVPVLKLMDLFLVISDTEFSSYVDDNTKYDSGNSIDDVISSLKESSEKLFQ